MSETLITVHTIEQLPLQLQLDYIQHYLLFFFTPSNPWMVKQSKCGTPYGADEYLNNLSYNFVITNLNLFVYLNIIGMNILGWKFIFWYENLFHE